MMATRNLGTLYPYLKSQLDFLLAQSAASPFSGAAIPAPKPKIKNKNKKGAKGGQIPKWGPYGRATYAAAPPNFAGGIFEAAVTPSSNLQETHAEIHSSPAPSYGLARQSQRSLQQFWACACGCAAYATTNCSFGTFCPKFW